MAGKKKLEPVLPDAQMDALTAGTKTIDEVEVLFSRLKKQMIERILGAELTSHRGYAPGEEKLAGQVWAQARRDAAPRRALRRTLHPGALTPVLTPHTQKNG
jgi:transposase-like protein